MKTILISVLLLFSINIIAQKKEKIKGNKEVVELYRDLDYFNKLVISDGLEVSLTQINTEGFKLITDANLVDVIKLEVIDSVLNIFSTHKITSKKKLEIEVSFVDLVNLTLSNSAKIVGVNNFDLTYLTLKCANGSNFELDLTTGNFDLEMDGNAKGKLKLKSDITEMTLNDNAYLKGSIASIKYNLTLNKRADLNIEGNCDDLLLVATGSTDIKAKNLKATNVNIQASNKSDIHVYVSNSLNIYAKGRSYIYVYGNPDIKIEGLNDKSQVIKK